MIGRRLIPVILLLYMAVFSVNAQNVGEMRDTIRAARIVSDRIVERDAGTRIIALPELRSMVSATGDADVIKYIQTLPGVSTGANGRLLTNGLKKIAPMLPFTKGKQIVYKLFTKVRPEEDAGNSFLPEDVLQLLQ